MPLGGIASSNRRTTGTGPNTTAAKKTVRAAGFFPIRADRRGAKTRASTADRKPVMTRKKICIELRSQK